MQHEIPIAFAFDKNYLKTGAVALYSLLHAHRAVERIIFSIYVFYSGLNEDDLNRLQETIKPFRHFAALKCQDISATLDSLPTITDSAWVNRYSRMILVKYLLPSLFPQYNKMIWSDVDVVFCRAFADDFIALDTSESFHLSGVINLVSQSVTEGFWFCNLDYMREHSFTQQVLEKFKIQAMRPYFKESTLIHHLHAYIKELPLHYCVLPYYYQEELDDLRHKASLPIWFEIIHQDKPNEFIYRQQIPYEISQIQDILSNPIIMHYESDKDALGIYNGKPWEFPLGNQYHLWLEMLAHTPFWKDFTLEMQKKRIEYRDIAQKIHYFSQDKHLYEVSIRSIKVFASHYYNLVVKERWSKPIKTFFQKNFFQKKF
ncbi:glycosyltransferase family 8 protein [Helicobacter pylori]|uniref:glycosyltransferase family 8 protein n=1 Tax=Helicobacter pylori TaxID=210 RepID=UPI0035627A4D